MSYSRNQERKYEQQPPPSLQKGKGFKPKGDYEKDLITKSTEKALRESRDSKTAE